MDRNDTVNGKENTLTSEAEDENLQFSDLSKHDTMKNSDFWLNGPKK